MTITHSLEKSKEPTSRLNPFRAKFLSCTRLSKEGSSKEILHVVLDVSGADFTYQVGSSIGIFPENAPRYVNEIFDILKGYDDEMVYVSKLNQTLSLKEFIQCHANLSQITSNHLKLIEKYDPSKGCHDLLNNKEKLTIFLATNDLASFLRAFWSPLIPLNDLVDVISPLLPRYYSIASSSKVVDGEAHLMIASFSYLDKVREKQSITAEYFKELVTPHKSYVRLFYHHNPNFVLPDDTETPIIMIGPGTGLAAFRGFIQERSCDEKKGKNWLFTGDRERKFDFSYEAELVDYVHRGLLKLDTAFSRDDPIKKVYVQDKLWDNRKELWRWIHEEGAHIYISGDAKRMARDVQMKLIEIIQAENQMTLDEAKEVLKTLKAQKRLVLDVY